MALSMTAYPPNYGFVIEAETGQGYEFAGMFGEDEKRANEVLRNCETTNPGEYRLIDAKAGNLGESLKNCGNCAWRKPYAKGRVFCRLEPPRPFVGYPLVPVFNFCDRHLAEKNDDELLQRN